MHAERGWHQRGAHPTILRGDPDSRRLSGTSGDWRGIWWACDPSGESHARKDKRDSTRCEDHFSRPATEFPGHEVPIADRRAEVAAKEPRDFRGDRRWHDYGLAAPQAACRGSAVPPGVCTYRCRVPAAREFPEYLAASPIL